MVTPNWTLDPGGRLLGIGVDLIEVERVQQVWERQGWRFLNRIFSEDEISYCLARPHPHMHLAARFAAKEAASKAFGTGIGRELGWKSIAVSKGERDEPTIVLDEKGRNLLTQVGGRAVLISLAHIRSHAIAMAAIVA